MDRKRERKNERYALRLHPPYVNDPSKKADAAKRKVLSPHTDAPPLKIGFVKDSYNILTEEVPFDDKNDEQSELSAYTNDDDSGSASDSSYVDNLDYVSVREYDKTPVGNLVYKAYGKIRMALYPLLISYWENFNKLNETRRNIIKDVNKRVTRPKKYLDGDVSGFNFLIDAIEDSLNACTPGSSKLKASFIKQVSNDGEDSEKKMNQALYQGYKYSEIKLLLQKKPDPSTTYKCTYNADPNSPIFKSPYLYCNARLVLDEKGYLQPGTFLVHYHDPICKDNELNNDEEPKYSRATLHRITSEGKIKGKRNRMNKFLGEKLREAFIYKFKACRLNSHTKDIDKEMRKLDTLDVDKLEERERNYVASWKEWIKFFLNHVKMCDVRINGVGSKFIPSGLSEEEMWSL